MKYRIIGILLMSVLLFCGSEGLAQKGKFNFDLPPIEWTPLEFDEFELPNGISCFVVEDREVPLVDFFFAFPSPFDPEDKVGLSSIATWVLRNGGSTVRSADDINEIIEFKAAQLNIYAGNELLSIYGSTITKDVSEILDIVLELIEHPAYPEERIELRRGTMIEEIRRRNDDPRSVGFREFSKLIYPDHPYGRETSINSVSSITRDDLLEFHNNVFQSNGAVFGISGDISKDEFRELIQDKFSNLPHSEDPLAQLPEAPPQAPSGIYYVYKNTPQTMMILLGHQSIKYDDPRRHAAVMMNNILGGGGFNSVLLRRIRVDEGLAYVVWSSVNTPINVAGRFMAGASTRPEQTNRTMTLMSRILKEYKENGPREDDLERARKSFLNREVWEYESSEDFLESLVFYKWRGLPLDTPQRNIEAYQKLTYEEVKQAAKELINPEEFIWVIVGDRDRMDTRLEDFGDVHIIELSE